VEPGPFQPGRNRKVPERGVACDKGDPADDTDGEQVVWYRGPEVGNHRVRARTSRARSQSHLRVHRWGDPLVLRTNLKRMDEYRERRNPAPPLLGGGRELWSRRRERELSHRE
jgi:hypothetical protein